MSMYDDLQEDQQAYFCKFQQFKQDYLVLGKMYKDSQQENELLQKHITVLENKLSLADTNTILTEALKKQETIVEHFLRKDDYLAMQNLCNTLQNRVQELEKKLETERAFYEEEVKNTAARVKKETTDLNEENKGNFISKIQQLEISNQKLIQANELLKTLMDEFTIEAENERAFFSDHNVKCNQEIERQKETIRVLESKNKLLFSQLVQQENWFDDMQLLGEYQKNEISIDPLPNKIACQTDYVQTLDEAFCITEDTLKEAKEQSLLTPFTTEDCEDLFSMNQITKSLPS